MPLIITPRQLSLRGELYHQLGALLSAGLPITSALDTLRKNPPARSYGKPLDRIKSDIEQGFTFSEALRKEGRWIPSFDLALLDAGEQSGRLDTCFKLLADYYRERSQLARETLGNLAYPIFIVHFAVFLAPFPALLITGDVAGYLLQTIGAIAPFYLFTFLLVYACQGKHGERWRSLIERIGRFIPVLGTARRHLALARLAAALEALINAGVSIIPAWELAAEASGSPALRRTVRGWSTQMEDGGEPPSTMLERSREFPELFANLYHTGEISGSLDETLARLENYYREEGSRKLRAFAQWFPRMVYFGILLAIAFQIVSFWSNYYSGILDNID